MKLPPAISLFLLAGLARGADGHEDGVGWALRHLDVEVFVEPAEAALWVSGTLVVELEAETSPGPAFGLSSAMRLTELQAREPEPSEVELNTAVPESAEFLVSVLRFDAPFSRGAILEIDFAGEKVDRQGQLDVSPGAAIGSWTDPWHPVPRFAPGESLAARSSAPGTTTFHLPAGWRALSNGTVVFREETEDGVQEVWELETPRARSFAAGPFTMSTHAQGGRAVSVYRLPGAQDSAQQAAALLAALHAMEARLGPYPYTSYGIVEIPESVGDFYAASHQGFIMAKSSAFRPADGNLVLFAHEMGHAWWGNLVGTEGPGGSLCSESLAQYGVVIALEAAEGPEAVRTFLDHSRAGYSPLQCAAGYFQVWRAGRDKPLAELQGGDTDHTLSDAKGHWVYHMLRREVGDETFFATLRRLLEDHAHRTLSLDQLRQAFVAAAPEAGLETFFAQWLDRTGAPVLELERRDAEPGRVAFTVRQLQPGDPYVLTLDVLVQGESSSRVHEIELRERQQDFALPAPGEPCEVVLDPHHRTLLWRPEYGPRPDLPAE